jgi:hypothetical protein
MDICLTVISLDGKMDPYLARRGNSFVAGRSVIETSSL